MGIFRRRRQAESVFSQAAEALSEQEVTGAPRDSNDGFADPKSRPAGASAMSALGGWSPELGTDDPEAAFKAASDALANSPWGSGPLSHLPMAQQIPEQVTAALARSQTAEDEMGQEESEDPGRESFDDG